ncbi:fructose-1,6-bisphosphatase, cytosolic-like [Hibiscus syriacus]|uniref:fructose-1,6-bisphosphatase, cytosolic-like n=1 Tax=Hibiscus syriacus TaxID=106335 RepID=UPI0019235A58|nr:fructose-1,6-bisphosphatase, cytosolic-like [Hibiscus syriacus]
MGSRKVVVLMFLLSESAHDHDGSSSRVFNMIQSRLIGLVHHVRVASSVLCLKQSPSRLLLRRETTTSINSNFYFALCPISGIPTGLARFFLRLILLFLFSFGEMDHDADAYRTDLMTITRLVLNEQSKYPESRGDFTILLNHIVLGCKFVCTAVNKAGLAKLIGLAGETNVQGEEQKKLDVLSNEVFVKALVRSGRTCILVSEEDEEATFVERSKSGRFFWIYKVKDDHVPTLDDVLQPGKHMLAAGDCMYGSSCTLVLSTGGGVNGFTLDPSLGQFILTHPDIKIPKKGKIYSVNEENAKNWDGPTAKYVEKCKFPKDSSSPKSLRYIGSMVADVHRTLLYDGIFLYPADKKSLNGKQRVLYEVFPMSFLMEKAGGQAFTGKQRALDLIPTKIHERSPIFLGNYDDVEEIKALYC